MRKSSFLRNCLRLPGALAGSGIGAPATAPPTADHSPRSDVQAVPDGLRRSSVQGSDNGVGSDAADALLTAAAAPGRVPGFNMALAAVTSVVLLGCLCAAPAAAHAADSKKMAATEFEAAEVAAKAGDHAKAFDHALQAWQLDEANAGYLWTAARQAHLGGALDQATALYRQWLQVATRDRSGDSATTEYLKAIAHSLGTAAAARASAASKAGDHGAARRLYLDAAAIEPDAPEHVYGAGLEALAVKDDVAGVRLLEDYLKVAPADAPHRATATRLIADRGLGVAERPAAVASAFEPGALSPRQRAGVWVAGGAAVLAVVGGGFFVASAMATSDLQAAKDRGADGSVQTPIEDRKDSHFFAGVGFGVAAVAAAGAGAWLWWGGEETHARAFEFHVRPGQVVAGLRF